LINGEVGRSLRYCNTRPTHDGTGASSSWALGHKGHLGSWALGLLGTWALGHLGTWALGHLGSRALGLSGTWALRPWSLGHLGTWALVAWALGHKGHLGSWAQVAIGLLATWAHMDYWAIIGEVSQSLRYCNTRLTHDRTGASSRHSIPF
jgi:hypothetical protein